MREHDLEIEELRAMVHCAVAWERTPPTWKLDRKESTRTRVDALAGAHRAAGPQLVCPVAARRATGGWSVGAG